MWVAKFKLKDDEDIYLPLCEKYRIDFFAYPYTHFIKNRKINLLVGGTFSGSEENKKKFIRDLKKDKRVKNCDQYRDFIFVHAQHSISREFRAEIKIFYNPQYIIAKPVHVASDGWEYWELACLDRVELNKIINAANKYYHGLLFSIKEEKLKGVTNMEFMPQLTEKQLEAVNIAFDKGYYNYPRRLTLPELGKITKKAYSTFQENLRKAEAKIIGYFLKNR